MLTNEHKCVIFCAWFIRSYVNNSQKPKYIFGEVIITKQSKGKDRIFMGENKNSVSFMREYLKYAIEFEKYVYIWTNSMNKANEQMKAIYSQRNAFENSKKSAHNSLATIDSRYSGKQKYNAEASARCKKNMKIARTVLIVDIVLCIIVGVLFAMLGFYMKNTQADYKLSSLAIIMIAPIIMVFTFIFTFVGPICIGVYFSNKSKSENHMEQANSSNLENSRRRQAIILKEQESRANKNLTILQKEESALSQKQEEILKSLQVAKKNLADIYSKNILPQKYRSLNAVVTLYEYLVTGRCNTIEGHGGIYDTYETDLQRGLIISTLADIRDSMYRIEDNQRLLYQEIQYANNTLSSINSNLTKIEKSNSEIARNTAISAVANQQTAEAARWMAWNAWSNGY